MSQRFVLQSASAIAFRDSFSIMSNSLLISVKAIAENLEPETSLICFSENTCRTTFTSVTDPGWLGIASILLSVCHSPSNPRDCRNHSFSCSQPPRITSYEPILPSRPHKYMGKPLPICEFQPTRMYSRSPSSSKSLSSFGFAGKESVSPCTRHHHCRAFGCFLLWFKAFMPFDLAPTLYGSPHGSQTRPKQTLSG